MLYMAFNLLVSILCGESADLVVENEDSDEFDLPNTPFDSAIRSPPLLRQVTLIRSG